MGVKKNEGDVKEKKLVELPNLQRGGMWLMVGGGGGEMTPLLTVVYAYE